VNPLAQICVGLVVPVYSCTGAAEAPMVILLPVIIPTINVHVARVKIRPNFGPKAISCFKWRSLQKARKNAGDALA
jgi:hypothetical protein